MAADRTFENYRKPTRRVEFLNPQGLKGDAILLESRILAVADVAEAMASHRPYRAALGIDAALKEIEVGRGTAFEATVVDACLRLFSEKQFVFSSWLDTR
jgi:HD-GYP domain-containing protein (c-di-GMP phosphodiesterase class II)